MSCLIPEAEKLFFERQKEFLRRLGASEAPCIFDVGGNVGQSIREYRELFPDSRITTFEPLPDCFATLSQHFGGKPDIKLEHLALAESAGTKPFYSTRCSAASSLLKPDEKVREKSAQGNYEYDVIEVTVDTLDGYCSRSGIEMIDILKIDVQGAEIGVLRGAKKLLVENAISLIYTEVLFAENYQRQSDLMSIASFLAGLRYVLWDIRPFLFTRAGRLWTANAIFVSGPSCSALESYPEEFFDPREVNAIGSRPPVTDNRKDNPDV